MLGILLAGFAVACGKPDDPSNEHHPKNENILRYDVNAPFSSLDPAKVVAGGATHVFPLLYSHLFVPDENGKLQPDLALSWQYDQKSSTWTIYLRKDVLFHDKKPVTPEDVIHSLDSALATFRSNLAFLVDNISTLSDSAVRIRLKEDDPGFLIKIWDMPIFPRPDGTEADFFHHPVGSGPFRYESREGNRKIVLEANEDYFAGRPFVDRFVFLYQPDKEKAWIRLLAGDTDIVQEISPKNYEMLKQYENRFYFHHYILRFYTILLYNTSDPLFSDPAVRRALAYAIDREHIVKGILKGYGVVANGPMGVDSPYHNPEVKPVPFDPQKALSFLKKAGWSHETKTRWLYKDGKPFEFTLLAFKESQIEKKVARYIQLCLNDLGIRVNLKTLSYKELHKRYYGNTDFQAVLTELNGLYRNPEHLITFWSPETNGKSYGSFEHPEVTRLIKKVFEEEDPEKRKQFFYEIDTLIASLQPGTFLFQKIAIDAMSKRFSLPHPFSITYEGIHRLRHAALRQQ